MFVDQSDKQNNYAEYQIINFSLRENITPSAIVSSPHDARSIKCRQKSQSTRFPQKHETKKKSSVNSLSSTLMLELTFLKHKLT